MRLGDGLRFLSRLHYLNGHRTLSEQTGHRAVALLEEFPGTAELALAYANLAHLAMLAEDAEEAVRWSEEAIPIAEALSRDDILATVLNNYGTAIQYRDPQRAFDMLDRSIALGLATGAQEHVARAHTNKCWMLMSARRHDEALAAQRQGIAFCVEHDLDTWRDYIAGGHALTLIELGRWSDAEEQAARVLADEQNSHLIRNPAARAMALLHIRRGSPDADALIEELSLHMQNGREGPRFTSLSLIVAEQCWTKGSETRPALALLGEAVSLAQENGSPWDRAALWHWARTLGQNGPAPLDMPEPYALGAAGDAVAAACAFEALGMPFEQALMLAKGNASQAARGLAILDRVGAPATAARSRVELKRSGGGLGSRGPRASTLGNRFGLTKREIDVLDALDKGWTNKEIGERLFVSAKTVDHHVSAILGKLDARTRGEAAAFARNEGLLRTNSNPGDDDSQR
jgi:DNA-binding CsgD family transcriptional regulator